MLISIAQKFLIAQNISLFVKFIALEDKTTFVHKISLMNQN